MSVNTSERQYEVLSPWADADPASLRGLSPRVNLHGKRIGLFCNSKRAARPVMSVLEKKMKERFPALAFSPFLLMPNAGVDDTDDRPRFDRWVKDVDAVVLAFGD